MGLETTNTEHEESEPFSDAHTIALDFAKQLITLSSGVLALTGTFIGALDVSTIPQKILLALSWILLILSVYYGLLTISAIIKSRLNSDHLWSTGEGRTFAKRSKLLFFAGIIAFVVFAMWTVLVPSDLQSAAWPTETPPPSPPTATP